MNYHLTNNQAIIANRMLMADDFTAQTARLAHFKINYYKFTLIRPSFKETREGLRGNIRDSLFNFQSPSSVLESLNFFQLSPEN